jgi:hypothetical protein
MSIDSRALPETVAFLQSAILRLQTTVDDLVRRVQRLEDDTKASSLAVDDRKLKVLLMRHWVAHGFFLPKALSPELVAQMVANAELAVDPSPAGVHKEASSRSASRALAAAAAARPAASHSPARLCTLLFVSQLTRRIQEVHSREFSELVQRVKLSVRDVVKARSANAWARHSFSRGVFRSMDEMRSAIFGSEPRAASSAAMLNQLCLLRVLAQQSLSEANEGKNVNMRRLFDTEMSRVLQLGADDLGARRARLWTIAFAWRTSQVAQRSSLLAERAREERTYRVARCRRR